MLGFMGKTSDVRIAQYETEARTPKDDLIKQLADIFGVTTRAITVPNIDSYLGLMHTFFALEDEYGFQISTDKDGRPCITLDKNHQAYDQIAPMLFAWLSQYSKLKQGEISEDEYYIAGEIVKVAKESDFFNEKYGNASFYIADDDDPANEQFYVFRTLYLGNRKWVEGDKQIEVGDQVVVCARLTKYKDKDGNIIPETFNGKIDGESVTPYLYSLNGQRE